MPFMGSQSFGVLSFATHILKSGAGKGLILGCLLTGLGHGLSLPESILCSGFGIIGNDNK